ncbi:MAG: CBS domain-containing protein [Candidatus Bathyarchaeota archaeon]|nr:MAG: CBS domain-containing protein [Candidatus Bathyarchaeota archaeon]
MTGGQLRKLRNELGLTQRQLAHLVGISQAHVAKIENGKVDPRLSTINKILKVLTEGERRKCRDIMTKTVIFAKPTDKVLKMSTIMIEKAISQMPVIQDNRVIGTVTEESIIKNLQIDIANETAEGIMDPPMPSIPEHTDVSMIRPLLEDHPGVLVVRKGEIAGIITRSDLLKTVTKVC